MKRTTIILDPAVQDLLETRGALDVDFDSIPLEQALRMARPAFDLRPPPAHSQDITIKGYQGAPIRVRLYRPETVSGTLPGLLHLHGGGFVGGSIERDDGRCDRFAREVGCIVASVDYRLAPEHRFPIAIEDAFAAWSRLTDGANDLGVDPARCAISGSSAGGHIAVGVTLLAKARGARMPLLQLLTYPVMDPAMKSASYLDFSNGPFMTQARMAWYWKQYTSDAIANAQELWAPLTSDPNGLPNAHVITAEYDVLRDEGESYAEHLRGAGREATVKRYPRMVHGFITSLPHHEASKAALANSAAALRKVFAEPARAGSRD